MIAKLTKIAKTLRFFFVVIVVFAIIVVKFVAAWPVSWMRTDPSQHL